MPHTTDESNPDTLPDPELNPLLNPLLAAHMGRWAEVFFTAPPEKRTQAVADLLRELEGANQANEARDQAPDVKDQGADNRQSRRSSIDEEQNERNLREILRAAQDPGAPADVPSLTCGICGHKNTTGHRFCGMCGALLQEASDQTALPEDSNSQSNGNRSEQSFHDALNRSDDSFSITGEENENDAITDWTMRDDDLPHFAMEAETVPYRYRLYIGVVLAILLVLLVYMAWRGTRVLSGATHSGVTMMPAAHPAAPPAVQPANNPPPENQSPQPAPPAPGAAAPEPGKDHRAKTPHKNISAAKRPTTALVPVTSNSPAHLVDNGDEELGMAEKYLSGTQGVARDRREASLWLWKAVGKGNLAATITLADLYLRGDGVPKNCDQGRLLLDAAARKGAKSAAVQLRNLGAFGCQ